MYLHNEVLEGKPPLMKNFVSSDQSLSWKQRPEVLRLRKRLLILIGLTIAFDCMSFITNCIAVAVNGSKKGQSSSGIWLYITPIVSLAFYALGFYSTHRCRRNSLLAFAWCCLVTLVIVILGIVVVSIYSAAKFDGNGAAIAIVMILIFAITLVYSIFQIFIIRYAFALAKLLKTTKFPVHARV